MPEVAAEAVRQEIHCLRILIYFPINRKCAKISLSYLYCALWFLYIILLYNYELRYIGFNIYNKSQRSTEPVGQISCRICLLLDFF